MQSPLKVFLITGSLIAASLGTSASATAAAAPPTLDTSIFACNNGVCEVGPGNVGAPFAAGLNVKIGNYTPAVERYYGACYKMTIISGSLPPGLQLSLPSAEWIVTGTPAQAGTYSFTVQFTQTQVSSFCGAGDGPPGTQQLSITIGTGSSDRLVATVAAYNRHQGRLSVWGFDVNISALYSVYKTSTGKLVIAAQPNNSSYNDGILDVAAYVNDPCGILGTCSLTLKDSLGSSVTVTLPPAPY